MGKMNRRGFLKTLAIAFVAGPALLAERRPKRKCGIGIDGNVSVQLVGEPKRTTTPILCSRRLEEHLVAMEKALWFGETTIPGRAVYCTAGVKEGIAVAA